MTRLAGLVLLAPAALGAQGPGRAAPGPSVDTYLAVRTPSAMAWSPDGRRLAIELTNVDGSEIRVVDVTGRGLTVARGIPPRRYVVDRADLAWSRDGGRLFYRAGRQYFSVAVPDGTPAPVPADTLPREAIQLAPDQRSAVFIRSGDLWVQDPAGGAQRRLTNGERFAEALPDFFGRLQQWPRWSPDSRKVAFSTWSERPYGGTRVGVADVATGAVRWIAPADSIWSFSQVEWSPDSRRLAISRLSSDYRRKQLAVVDDTGAERIVRDDRDDKWIAHNIDPSFAPKWSPDGTRLAFVSIATGWRHLYVADLEGGGVRQLTDGPFEVVAPSWSPDGRALLAISTREHLQAPRPVTVDPVSGRMTSIEPTMGSAADAWWPGYMAGPSWSPDGGRIAYALSGSADPYQVRIWDRQGTGAPNVIYSARADGLDPRAAAPIEPVAFPSGDGTTVRGVLYRKASRGQARPGPALVHMYGGWGQLATVGWDIAIKSRLFQYLANRGYTVLIVDPRGSDGYGADYAHGLYHDAAGKQADDLVAAARFLTERGLADPKRIALHGHSYGAFLALATMIGAPNVFAAGLLQSGVFDFPRSIPLTATYAGIRFADSAHMAARGQPVGHVDRLTAPVLIAHGTADFNAPYANSEQLVTELRRAGKAFELISYPGERHDWERPETSRDFLKRVAAFLDRSMPLRAAGVGSRNGW